MGQAKQRGTFEQRKSEAVARDNALLAEHKAKIPMQKQLNAMGSSNPRRSMVVAAMMAAASVELHKPYGWNK